jgi:predicted protein tyrosine phosphatase
MITSIDFLPHTAVAELANPQIKVVVSMLAASEEYARPTLERFAHVLCLQFEDWSEELAKYPDFWPDDPTESENASLACAPGEKVFSLSDAKAIVDFVLAHHGSPASVDLVAHCHGGVSRSAAVALWVSARLKLPMPANRDSSGANERVLRLLQKADELAARMERSRLLRRP